MSTGPEHVDDYVRAVSSRWRWIVSTSLVGLLIGMGITAVLPPVFLARAVIQVPQPSNSTAAIGGVSPVNILRGLVDSIELQQRVSRDTGIPRKGIEDTLTAKSELARNQLHIEATGTDKARTLAVVQSATSNLQTLAREKGLGLGSRQAALLLTAIKEREAELDEANQALREFQKVAATTTNQDDPASATYYLRRLQEAQTDLRALDSEMAGRQREARSAGRNPELPTVLTEALPERKALLEAEAEFEIARKRLGEDNPAFQQALQKLEEARGNFSREVSARMAAKQQGLDQELGALEARRIMARLQVQFYEELAKKAPEEAVQFLRLNFEIESLESVLKSLRASYDQASLRSEVDAFTWSILSSPRAFDEPINKNYGMNGFLGFMVGLFLGGAYSIARHGR